MVSDMLFLKQYQRDSGQLVCMCDRLFATSSIQCREDAGRNCVRRNYAFVVPLPVRWGVVQQKTRLVLVSSCFFLLHFFVLTPGGAQPSKHANIELMKVPNFLHLSPPVVSQHCAALAR